MGISSFQGHQRAVQCYKKDPDGKMVLGAQVKSLPGSGPIFLIGRGQAGSLVSRVTWEITSDPWEGNKIYRNPTSKAGLPKAHAVQ